MSLRIHDNKMESVKLDATHPALCYVRRAKNGEVLRNIIVMTIKEAPYLHRIAGYNVLSSVDI